jgi:hypothetical protein
MLPYPDASRPLPIKVQLPDDLSRIITETYMEKTHEDD